MYLQMRYEYLSATLHTFPKCKSTSDGMHHIVTYLTASSAEVKNAWSCASTPPTRLHGLVLS